MKRNTHRIYYIGNLKFLVVRKEEGVYPASWQRVVFTYEQLWDEIKNLGFNYYMWKFKNDHKFWMAFKAADTPEEFIQNVRKLMKESVNEGVDWKAFYTMAKDTSGYNPSFEKKYGKLLNSPHIKDALDKTKDSNSFMKFIKKFESVNEEIKVGSMVYKPE
jgi:hypothetical protein